MLYTHKAVQENLRNRDGKRVFFLGKGDQLTSDARSFLTREGIEILPASQAKPERWKLHGGGFCEEKSEDMTHLNGDTLVKKTHPRIQFRGTVDLLEAEILWCMQEVPEFRAELQELLDFARKLIRWDVLEEPAPEVTLGGMDAEQLRKRSHFPQDFYGKPHFMPEGKDDKLLLQINLARAQARQLELAALHAFSDRDGKPTRTHLLKALNRLSSYLYILMIELKA